MGGRQPCAGFSQPHMILMPARGLRGMQGMFSKS